MTKEVISQPPVRHIDGISARTTKRDDAATVMKNWETYYGLKKVANFDSWVLYRYAQSSA